MKKPLVDTAYNPDIVDLQDDYILYLQAEIRKTAQTSALTYIAYGGNGYLILCFAGGAAYRVLPQVIPKEIKMANSDEPKHMIDLVREMAAEHSVQYFAMLDPCGQVTDEHAQLHRVVLRFSNGVSFTLPPEDIPEDCEFSIKLGSLYG